MGVDFNGVKLLLWSNNLGVSFERTLTLGRQGLVCAPGRFHQAIRDFGLSGTQEEIDRCLDRPAMQPLYAEEFFRLLGAREIVSMDHSDFEGATLLHDLNEPFPEDHREHYSFVFDGGTLEHVFNYPTALRHCLESIRPGGHFLTIAPAHNLMGHGFYQISPELFFRVFNADNGFSLRKVVLYDPTITNAPFFEVKDPAVTGLRTELSTSGPMYLVALAQRTAAVPVLTKAPQQSDYVAEWQAHRKTPADSVTASTGFLVRLRTRLNPYWPFWLLHWKRSLIHFWKHGAPKLNNRQKFRKLSREEILRERTSPQN